MKVKHFITMIVLFLTIMIGIVAIGIGLEQHHHSIAILHKFLVTHTLKFLVWRYAFFALLIFFWPYCIEWIGAYKHWNPVMIKKLSSRLYGVGFFAMFELIIVFNIFGHLINYIFLKN